MDDPKQPPTESNTVLSKIEASLYEIIKFIERLLITAYDIMLKPKKFSEHLILDSENEISLKRGDYTPPLTYLFVFTLLCAIYGFWAGKTPEAANLLLQDEIFRPMQKALTVVWKYVEKLDFVKIFAIMVPLVMLTILWVSALNLGARWLKYKSSFKIQLFICSYVFGTYLLLHGLLFAYAMAVSAFEPFMKKQVLLWVVLAWHLFIVFLIFKTVWTFIKLESHLVTQSKVKALQLIAGSCLIFISLFVPIMAILFPFFVL